MNSAQLEAQTMTKIADNMGVSFSLFGDAITNEEAFSTDGALPLIYFSADLIAKELDPSFDIGCRVIKSETSLFGAEAVNDPLIPGSMRMLFCLEALTRVMKPRAPDATNETLWDLGALFSEISPLMMQSIENTKPETL